MIPCFVEIKSKQQILWYIQNIVGGFLLQSTYNSSYSSQNYVSKNPLFFPKTLPFGIVPSHITMIRKQQKFKIQTNKVP